MSKVSEYRELTLLELEEEYVGLLKEHMQLRFYRATDQLAQTHKFKVVRRNIARAKTILREKRIDG